MNAEATALWQRALQALESARSLLPADPDAASSRAYYSAFYAVSARFAIEGKTFVKHSALEAAVHRDLTKPGIWPETLGKSFSRLVNLRLTGDYGGDVHVPRDAADEAVRVAADILRAVADEFPDAFTGLGA